MYHYGYHMMTPVQSFPFAGLISLIFWALLIVLVIGLLVHMFDNRHKEDEDNDVEADSALKILKIRYAKGELTKKEFLEMKKDVA